MQTCQCAVMFIEGIVLLSPMHYDQDIDKEIAKPDMIVDYNKTKSGVDTSDQLCANYSVSMVNDLPTSELL
ncbi:hypothetical protein Trydic_g3872 [Trypoxylus dichotomus]